MAGILILQWMSFACALSTFSLLLFLSNLLLAIYLFGAGSSPRLFVACLRTSSLDIFIFYFVIVAYSYLFSALLTSHIITCHLLFVAFELIPL
jgi:hypothetical protein